MPSRIDEAGHTRAFDYPVAEHWGESRNVQFRGWDSNRQHIGPESNTLPTEPPQFPSCIVQITVDLTFRCGEQKYTLQWLVSGHDVNMCDRFHLQSA